MSTQENECCPPFHPEPWDDVILDWTEKPFIKAKVCTLFFMPLNFGQVITKLNKKVDAAGAQVPDWLCLSDHTSKWNMDILLAVDKQIPNAENLTISGKFYSRVYEGNFRETDKWCKDYFEKAKEKGINTRKMYMWYTTCPKCAKKYGKNYVVIISKIE